MGVLNHFPCHLINYMSVLTNFINFCWIAEGYVSRSRKHFRKWVSLWNSRAINICEFIIGGWCRVIWYESGSARTSPV
ncbi:hypothetical protein BD779DRAFT_737429 [Infundibulicybe gibba]|nr:hypothetical protein BD779DRAFT_737429 [Infundibulicybe gibba]